MHPFGASATLACLPVLGFISFFFLFHCDTTTSFNWLLVFYYYTFSMCVHTCVFHVYVYVYMQLRKSPKFMDLERQSWGDNFQLREASLGP